MHIMDQWLKKNARYQFNLDNARYGTMAFNTGKILIGLMHWKVKTFYIGFFDHRYFKESNVDFHNSNFKKRSTYWLWTQVNLFYRTCCNTKCGIKFHFCHFPTLFFVAVFFFFHLYHFLFPPVSRKAIEKCYLKKNRRNKKRKSMISKKQFLFNNVIITSAIAENSIKIYLI